VSGSRTPGRLHRGRGPDRRIPRAGDAFDMAGHVPVGLDRGKAGGIGVSGVPIEAPATPLKSAGKRDMRGGKTIIDIAQKMIRVMAAGARPFLAPIVGTDGA